uniref:Uncharacterized protein n=1 Tax=Anguilla anguilla TaxID=7936 RepID=A0A0E9VLR5_ANGAN
MVADMVLTNPTNPPAQLRLHSPPWHLLHCDPISVHNPILSPSE